MLAAQEAAARSSTAVTAAAKADPSHGWKRWVSKDGVLTAPPDKPADVARSAALKKSLQSKVAAKEEERQAKKKPASGGGK